MKVDFNQLRLNLQTTHNELVELINDNFDPEHERIIISPHYTIEMKEILKELRLNIALLMCMYDNRPTTIDNISDQSHLSQIEFLD